MASGSDLPTSTRLTMTASTPALRQPLGCPWVSAASSLPVAKMLERKRSELWSRTWEAAKYIPTGAMRITPPQPLLSFMARGKVTRAMNDSKGCGGVMRMAPVGMYFAASHVRDHNSDRLRSNIFATGSELAALTHGHPSGCLSAGVLAVIVSLVLVGKSLPDAIHAAKEELRKHPSHKEVLSAIAQSQSLAASRPRERRALRELGIGFVAEEALAMGLYCSLGAKDFEDGIILAVNHSGDSDSTGSITGNLLGAAGGVEAIPDHWLARLELRPTIEALADDLAAFRAGRASG